jgi:type III pantothenate kinase
MLSGVISGLSFEIEGFAKELSKKYKDLLVILSGGDSRYVAGKLSLPVEVQPDLALTGLYKILSFNVKKAR